MGGPLEHSTSGHCRCARRRRRQYLRPDKRSVVVLLYSTTCFCVGSEQTMSRHPAPSHLPSNLNPLHSTRHRFYSDPFSDPVYASKPIPRLPPEPPPKFSAYNRRANPPKPVRHRDNMADALRDTVQVRHPDQPSRSKMGKNQTVAPYVLFSFLLPVSPLPPVTLLPIPLVVAVALSPRILPLTQPTPRKRPSQSLTERRAPYTPML